MYIDIHFVIPIFHCGGETNNYCCDGSVPSQGQRVTKQLFAVTVSLSNHKEISDEFASSRVLVCVSRQVCQSMQALQPNYLQ